LKQHACFLGRAWQLTEPRAARLCTCCGSNMVYTAFEQASRRLLNMLFNSQGAPPDKRVLWRPVPGRYVT